MKLVFLILALTFFAVTQGRGFLHPKEATIAPFHEVSPQEKLETVEFKQRLRMLFVIWQVKLMLNKIWTFRDKLEKAPATMTPAKRGQEKLLTEIADNFDAGMFTLRAWLKMLQGGL